MSAHAEKDTEHKENKGGGHGHGGGGGHGGGHGGGGGHEEHEGAPEWLISFADNVTLMMGFFVILLAANMGPKGTVDTEARADGPQGPPLNFLDAAISIREAFNNPVNPNSMDPADQTLVRRMMERRGKGFALMDGPIGDEHNVQSLKIQEHEGLCGLIHFKTDLAELDDDARSIIRQTARHMRGVRLRVEVRGHVSAAEAYRLPDRGMQLGFQRALAVANEMAKSDVEWKRLRVVSCADNERLNTETYNKAGHEDNARVEIVLTNEILRAEK